MLSTLIIIAVAIAIYRYSRHAAHRRALRESIHFIDDISPRLRISIVVSGTRGIGYITSLLRSPSTSYQVVIVADYAAEVNLLREITQHFGLFAANYTPSGEILPGAIRTLYRSHKQLYSRVIVVDSPASSHYTPFEVGAAVSDYNYNMQIASTRTLREEAIYDLLLELASHPEGSIEKITSRLGERFKLICREAALPEGDNKIKVRKGRRLKLSYRILQ